MIDMQEIEQIIRHVAAIEVMPRFKNLKDSDIREKNPGDLVTVADEASEKLFTKLLQEALPGSLVVGEEAVSKDLNVLERLKEGKPVWVIDPIDGTYNFSQGRSKFGILIALVVNGETQYGWAFDALGDRMAVAEKGRGVKINGVPVTRDARKDVEIKDMVVRAGGAQAWHFETIRNTFAGVVNQRCSLHDFMDFITGDADILFHVGKVTPWDHAAGVLMAQEAGGYVGLDDDGKAYDPARHGPGFLTVMPSVEWAKKLHGQFYTQLRRE